MEQQRCREAEQRLDWLSKTLSSARAGVEHLADKLQHITLVTHHLHHHSLSTCSLTPSLDVSRLFTVPPVPLQSEDAAVEVSPDSNEYVLHLMTQCNLKLQLLQEELRGHDLAAVMKEMEEEEVGRSISALSRNRRGLETRLWFWVVSETCLIFAQGNCFN